jgi:hypothetical protein
MTQAKSKLAACAAVLVTTLGTVACNPDDEGVFKGGGTGEFKPKRTLLSGGEGLDGLGATSEVPTVAAAVTYKITVTSESEAELCTGSANVEIMSDFAIKLPSAKLQCASLTIDLGGMLGGGGIGASGVGPDGKKDPKLSHDGMVLSAGEIGGATFTPPRPFLLGPVIQDVTKYEGFTRTTDHTVAGTTAAGQGFSGQGRFTINVLKTKTDFSNAETGLKFDNVMLWEMRADGFDGVPGSGGLVFSRMLWAWNVRPIMIPALVIEGYLKDFVETKPGGPDTSALTGVLKIQLAATQFTGG